MRVKATSVMMRQHREVGKQPLYEGPDQVSSNNQSSPQGLSDAEAASRLKTEGPNELPQPDRRTQLHIALDVLKEPMFSLLLGSGAIYLVLGDLRDAAVLLLFALISVIITIVQETRSERVLEALRDLASPRALVIRDGLRQRIAGRDVVRGDVLVLSEGDRVPADARLIAARDLQADESLLTGEPVPVRKATAADIELGDARPGGEDLPFIFAGTMIVRGQGLAEVCATGIRSEIGKIGKALGAIEREAPSLKLQIAHLVRLLAVIGVAVSVISILLYGLFRGSWLDGLLGGIALSMSMLPQEFPLILAVFMAMGAWRISKARVLTRRSTAIEALGAATVLCTDKTGTLTMNRMAVAELRIENRVLRLDETSTDSFPKDFLDLAKHAMLASAIDPFDPMEKAIHALLPGASPGSNLIFRREYGLRPDLLAVTHVWQEPGGGNFLVASKGAPEAIAGLCRLDEAAIQAIRQAADEMAAEGIRVLGVASAQASGDMLPDSPKVSSDFPIPCGRTYLRRWGNAARPAFASSW
jgi:Ca2+-transporting ATPase